MADMHTTLYDTWQPGATANAQATLFQTPQGGDATHNEQFTNARGAGQLPAGESFLVKVIKLMNDEQIAEADFDTRLHSAIIELTLRDLVMIKAPAGMFFAHSAYGGHFTQATAALTQSIGQMGEGFVLDIPIMIAGGERFTVRCVQGPAFAAVIDHKVILEGILSLPS